MYFRRRGRPTPTAPRRAATEMPEQTSSPDPRNRSVVASYVAEMSADLASMARGTGLDTLGYLLEMVRLEAENVSRDPPRQNGSL